MATLFLLISPLIILSFVIILPVRRETLSSSSSFTSAVQIVRRYTIKEMQAFARASSIAEEVLGAIRTVTAFAGEKKEEAR